MSADANTGSDVTTVGIVLGGVFVAWCGYFVVWPYIQRCTGRFINRRIEKRLDLFDAKEESLMKRLPPVLYDPVTQQYYLQGTKPKAKKRGDENYIIKESDEEIGDDTEADENQSIADVENGGFKTNKENGNDMNEDEKKDVIQQKELISPQLSSDEALNSSSPARKKRLPPIIPMSKRKMDKLKAREAEQKQWDDAMARATYVPTRAEKIAMGKKNYIKNFIYKPPTKLGFQLTRERIDQLGGQEGIENLYQLKSPVYFHQLDKEEQRKYMRDPLDELPEWDTQSTVITSGSRRLKKGYRYKAKRIIAVYEDPLLELHGNPDPDTVALINLRTKRKERELREKELELDNKFAAEEERLEKLRAQRSQRSQKGETGNVDKIESNV